jgi:endoglucanase
MFRFPIMRSRWYFFPLIFQILVLLLLPGLTVAATPLVSPPLCKVMLPRTLNGIGVNVASWVADSERQPPSTADLATIRKAGFTYVRLPFNPEALGFQPKNPDPKHPLPQIKRLDDAVAALRKQGFYVLLDMHPSTAFRLRMEKNPRLEKPFIALWQYLAHRYTKDLRYGPYAVGFQLLNEPQYYNRVSQWNALQRQLLQAVRAETRQHLIVVAPAMGGDRKTLKLGSMELFPDERIVYGIPFYEPMIITHQGDFNQRKSKNPHPIGFLKNVAWPAAQAKKQSWSVLPGGNLRAAQAEVDKYLAEGWKRETLRKRLQPALDWAQQKNVCLFITEYGAIRTNLDPFSRTRWIADATATLKAAKLPGAVWDFSDNFGIARPTGAPVVQTLDGALIYSDPRTAGQRQFIPEIINTLQPQKQRELR